MHAKCPLKNNGWFHHFQSADDFDRFLGMSDPAKDCHNLVGRAIQDPPGKSAMILNASIFE